MKLLWEKICKLIDLKSIITLVLTITLIYGFIANRKIIKKEMNNMARIKISELNEKTQIADNDLLPIVDAINTETKKISVENLLQNYETKGDIVVTREPADFGTTTIPMTYFEGYSNYEILFLEFHQSGLTYKGNLRTTGRLPFKIDNTYRPGIMETLQYVGGTNPQLTWYNRTITVNDNYMIIGTCNWFNINTNTTGTTNSYIQPVVFIGYK